MLTIATVKKRAKELGGAVVKDGCGGWDLVAPDGTRWRQAEVCVQPIPVGEAESTGERQEMLHTAMAAMSEGVECWQC